jgi:hypothetical protein
MRYELQITFNPKPANPVSVPCPVMIDSRCVGELFTYDSRSGSGKAMLDGELKVPELMRLTVLDYGFIGMGLLPKYLTGILPIDEREIDAILKLTPENLSMDDALKHVTSKLSKPMDPELVRRQVAQWWTINNSP